MPGVLKVCFNLLRMRFLADRPSIICVSRRCWRSRLEQIGWWKWCTLTPPRLPRPPAGAGAASGRGAGAGCAAGHHLLCLHPRLRGWAEGAAGARGCEPGRDRGLPFAMFAVWRRIVNGAGSVQLHACCKLHMKRCSHQTAWGFVLSNARCGGLTAEFLKCHNDHKPQVVINNAGISDGRSPFEQASGRVSAVDSRVSER